MSHNSYSSDDSESYVRSTRSNKELEVGHLIGNRGDRAINFDEPASISEKNNQAIEDLAISAWSRQLQHNSSIISDAIMGQLISQTLCESCGDTSYAFQHFHLIDLDLPSNVKAITLDQLMTNFSTPTLIEKFSCSGCLKISAGTRRRYFYKLPQVLIVSLARFDSKTAVSTKNRCLVTVDLDEQNFAAQEKGRDKASESIFSLYMIVVASIQ